MATYLELYRLASDSDFQTRLKYALLRAAYDISNESADTPFHSKRMAWARARLSGENSLQIDRLAIGVLLNPTIAAAGALATDEDLQFQVNSIVSALDWS